MQPLVACRECDLLHRAAPVAAGAEARCTRCGALLYRAAGEGALTRALAFTIAAGILFLVANAFPIVALEAQGTRNAATLLGAVDALWAQQARAVAGLVFVTTLLIPAAELFALTYVLTGLYMGRHPRGLAQVLRFLETVKPWGMVEVFVLGVLVSLVKLAHVAVVEPGIALFSFGGLMLMLVAAAASFDPAEAWSQLEPVS